MRGVGRATAAITIANALPSGIGAALGIGLETTVELLVYRDGRDGSEPVVRPSSAATPLVRKALEVARARYLGDAADGRAELSVRSDIPVGRGLKSSSAVASAVVRAVADAVGARPPAVEVARLVAQVSRESGVSATGAFDDALAGVRPGIVVTDNATDRLLHELPAPSAAGVVLWIPVGEHAPSPALRERFAAEAPAAREILPLLLRGDWAEAMGQNSELVERVMGYRYGGLRAECRRRGALASGTSGMGPAFAAVVPENLLSTFSTVFPATGGMTRSVALSTSPPEAEAR